MSFTKTEFTFPSVSSLADIHAVKYIPDGEIKAVFQIAHGMAEHIVRYESFCAFLAEKGLAVYINDHLGHGKSVKNDGELGFFGKNDGWKNFVEDCRKLTEIAKSENPGKPYVFFGHSMGSFVARAYALKYGNDIDAAVFCGTAGANPASGAGIFLANTISKFKGDHYRSKLIDKIAFGTYNKRCEGRTPFDWLTRDTDIVDKYVADPYCGFLFTAPGYVDLFKILAYVNNPEWYSGIRKTLPVLLISGAEDPVSTYGKGVTEVRDKLLEAGMRNVTTHLYTDCRHEILNESKAVDKVERDIISFIESVI